jgi:hypothetical protein
VFLSTHKESGIVANSIPVEYKAFAGKLKNHLPVEITAVNRTELEPLWDYMVKSYHYLGYKKMIGPRIKYLARFEGIPIAALSYKSAFFKVAARDAYIGWNAQQKNLYLKRFFDFAASFVPTSRCSTTLGQSPWWMSTTRARYRAANWIYLGETSGFA